MNLLLVSLERDNSDVLLFLFWEMMRWRPKCHSKKTSATKSELLGRKRELKKKRGKEERRGERKKEGKNGAQVG